ncbi:MAG: hypothetical protein JRM80_09630 [Nitrososphaerota archaeon]|nr:hypothetical protein [Nitrososphaerota archaeon]
MVELLEYTMVLLVSTLFVAGSAETYSIFSGYYSGLEFRAASSSVFSLATEALAGGSAAGSVSVPRSTVSCSGGVLTFASGGTSRTEATGESCDFSLDVQAGVRAFDFAFTAGRLTLTVS